MMNSTDIKKIAKKIMREQQGLRDIEIMHPAREWHIGILIAVIILAGSVLWSTATYYKSKQEISSNVKPIEVEQVVYRESLVKAALSEFEKRRNVRGEIAISPVIIPEAVSEISSTTALAATSTEEVVDVIVESSATTTQQ